MKSKSITVTTLHKVSLCVDVVTNAKRIFILGYRVMQLPSD